jgi:hypothetical protein
MPELDLTTGDRKGTGTRGSSSSSPKTRASSANRDSAKESQPAMSDSVLKTKLNEVFTDLAEWRGKKGDDELAEALEESREDMADGLVALTKTVKLLRTPLAFAVNFVKPILAFGKPARILAPRIVTWRSSRQQAQQEPQQPYVSQ